MNDEQHYADYLEGALDDATLDPAARAELDDLRRLLGTPEMWADPPPGLADDIVAEIRAEAPLTAPAPTPARSTRERRWLRPVLAVAAAVLVVVAAAAVLATRDDGGGQQFALAATDVIPGASGE